MYPIFRDLFDRVFMTPTENPHHDTKWRPFRENRICQASSRRMPSEKII